MSKVAFTTTHENLSMAWAETLLAMMEPRMEELTPAVITIRDFEEGNAVEDSFIRNRLDDELRKVGKRSCSEVSHTIFPESLWNKSINDDGEHMFARFNNIWPRVRKAQPAANKSGTYFQRLTSFRSQNEKEGGINQLRHVIDTYKYHKNHRRSALLATVFDPALDHSHAPILGFPCLHQVSFTPVGTNGLCVTGYYAMQYQFEKAYGNYLGLCNLGQFMAHYMGLKLEQVTCIASVAKRDRSIKQLSGLATDISEYINAKEAREI